MAENDVYLKSVPTDADSDDVRLTNPTIPVIITGTVATGQGSQSIAAVGQEAFTGTVLTAQGSQSIAATGSVLTAIVGDVATGQGSQSIAAILLVSDDADTHDGGGKRKRKPIIYVKPGWEPIHGLKTRKRKQIDNIEIAPLVVPGQPDLVVERYARMKEEEEIILLLAA